MPCPYAEESASDEGAEFGAGFGEFGGGDGGGRKPKRRRDASATEIEAPPIEAADLAGESDAERRARDQHPPFEKTRRMGYRLCSAGVPPAFLFEVECRSGYDSQPRTATALGS